MNPQQPVTPVSPPQIKPSKSKLRLLLVSTILLILTLTLLPGALFLSMFNDSSDPTIAATVNGILLAFALIFTFNGIAGVTAIFPYRKLAKSYRYMTYLYTAAILSIPFLLVVIGVTTALSSVIFAGEVGGISENTVKGQLLGSVTGLLYLTAGGIFNLSIACIVVSIRLMRKKYV